MINVTDLGPKKEEDFEIEIEGTLLILILDTLYIIRAVYKTILSEDPDSNNAKLYYDSVCQVLRDYPEGVIAKDRMHVIRPKEDEEL